MHLLFRFFLLFLVVFSIKPAILVGQQQYTGNLLGTKKGKSTYVLTPDSLSRQLTSHYKNDLDKVRSIFVWITQNISYNYKPTPSIQRVLPSGYVLEDDPNDTGALKPLSERVAIDVLNKRIAFCDGYARLFKTLCDYAGIRSEVITGYASGGLRSRKFVSNHRWNAVYLDSTWHLLDATWASGYITYGSDNFVQHYNSRYFLTPPAEFINDHYPEEHQWSLLATPPKLSEYHWSPFKTNAFVRKRIRSYKPETGLVNAFLGDTIRFQVETDNEIKKLFIINSAFVDSTAIANALLDSSIQPPVVDGNLVTYSYVVNSPNAEWLHLILEDEMIMRYRINVRRRETVANH